MTKLLETKEGRDQLVWACRFADSPEVHHCRRWAPGEYDACEVVADPSKLAAMLASEGQRLGFVPTPPFVENQPGPECPHGGIRVAAIVPGGRFDPRIDVEWRTPDRESIVAFMPRARTILAAWLLLQDGARDDAVRVLRAEL
jgi:hypothetical protein